MSKRIYDSNGKLKFGFKYNGIITPPILNVRKVGRHRAAAHPRFLRQCEKRAWRI